MVVAVVAVVAVHIMVVALLVQEALAVVVMAV
jgi:hypothetical protein